jgi:hypothetical protein
MLPQKPACTEPRQKAVPERKSCQQKITTIEMAQNDVFVQKASFIIHNHYLDNFIAQKNCPT